MFVSFCFTQVMLKSFNRKAPNFTLYFNLLSIWITKSTFLIVKFFSYRLELMRQIYNSSDSPTDSFAIYSSPDASPNDPPYNAGESCSSDQTTPTNPPNEFNANNYFFNSAITGQSNDIFQCFQTTCASVVANSSRLSLANLIPSRQANFNNSYFAFVYT